MIMNDGLGIGKLLLLRVASMCSPDLSLDACAKSSTPCVLVACKCDLPLSSRQINPREVEVVCMDETGFEAVQTSIDAPDTHKRCISIMLRGIMLDHSGQLPIIASCVICYSSNSVSDGFILSSRGALTASSLVLYFELYT